MSSREYHIPIADDNRESSVLDCLQHASELSRQQLKQAMSKGAVWSQIGKNVRPLRRDPGSCKRFEQLHFYYDPNLLKQTALELSLIDDAKEFSVWHKPYGMRSQGSRWGDHTALIRQVELQLDRPASIVHRLDRAAQGLILVAHNKAGARHLSKAFAEHLIDKRYQIIVEGCFPKEEKHIDLAIDGKPAGSIFRKIDDLPANRSLIDVSISSGRKHQIRVHAASLGHPVVGDRLHGNAIDGDIDLQLCAYHLKFQDRHGEEREYQIDASDALSLTKA